jgi:HTH-type transcriptional regulator/antitoxin HigA
MLKKYRNNEYEHFPIESPDPIEAIKFRMEQMNLNNNDLVSLFTQRSLIF